MRHARSLLSLLALASVTACGGARALPATPLPPPPPPPVAAPAPSPVPAEVSAPAAPAAPSASDRVRASLDALPPIPGEEAAWLPLRLLEIVARVTGELPAPTAPSVQAGAIVWSLVAPASAAPAEPAAQSAVCEQVTQAEPRLVCAVDTITVGATERVRFAFGWRRGPGELVADLALPLRALARLPPGLCLLSAERTLHTLDLEVRVPDLPTLGSALARMATVPRLSDLIMVRAEPQGAGLRVLLSWPTDRVERTRGELGRDAWPARCDERVRVGGEAPGALSAVALLQGERGRGAVLQLGRHEYLVTEGDQLGDATVTAISAQGVYVRRASAPRARPRLLRFAAPAVTAPAPARPAPPLRIPLPPEPPATP